MCSKAWVINIWDVGRSVSTSVCLDVSWFVSRSRRRRRRPEVHRKLHSFCNSSYLSRSDRLAPCFTLAFFFILSRASFADDANSMPPTTTGRPDTGTLSGWLWRLAVTRPPTLSAWRVALRGPGTFTSARARLSDSNSSTVPTRSDDDTFS